MKFAVASLDLLVVALLDVSLEDAGSGRLVEAGSLEDVGGIDPVVGLAPHDMFAFGIGAGELVLPYRVLDGARGTEGQPGQERHGTRTRAHAVVGGREDAVSGRARGSHDGTRCCVRITAKSVSTQQGQRSGGWSAPGWIGLSPWSRSRSRS